MQGKRLTMILTESLVDLAVINVIYECVYVCMCVCVCVCCQPEVYPVCPNHEVLEFQHRTVTGPDLGYFANAYTIFLSPCHTCSNHILYRFILLTGPISYRPPPPRFHPLTSLLSIFTHCYLPPPSCPVAEQLSMLFMSEK